MDYVQKNPRTSARPGRVKPCGRPSDTVFDWQYALEEKKLLALYEKGKSMTLERERPRLVDRRRRRAADRR